MKNRLDILLAYHQRTKHHFKRYAAGPGELDWKNQPDPFRCFAGSPRLELPLLAGHATPSYVDLYHPQAIPPQALTLSNIAALLEVSFGISAWKQYDDTRWALRCNPSSGNLHPTEAYVVTAGCDGIENGVHHYVSRDHALEQRCQFDANHTGTPLFPKPDSFLVGLSSIHWREAWKYGERAFRYCQHDAGHAIAAIRYAAAMQGWHAQVLTAWSDADIAAILGCKRDEDFNGAEPEHPDLMMIVTCTPSGISDTLFEPAAFVAAANNGKWHGQANALTAHHRYEWPAIEEAAQACEKPATRETYWTAPTRPVPASSPCTQSAVDIFRQRRSAQSFDQVTPISPETFFRMLDITLPRRGVPPFDAIHWEPRVDLLVFVHRVTGLTPGLYLLVRNPQSEGKLRPGLNPDFEWIRAEGCPAHFRLFRLVTADSQSAARAISCHQDIAADGAFSLGMLAEYEANLAPGPWVYRQLFWEAGILGQALYLEAEATGVRGTGIGCYFDDAVHDLLGIKDQSFQSMYHFTVGTALTDTRLQTLPAYAHLKRT